MACLVRPLPRPPVAPQVADQRKQKPWIIASTNGGRRLTVSSSRMLIVLRALAGIALSQSGTPCVAPVSAASCRCRLRVRLGPRRTPTRGPLCPYQGTSSAWCGTSEKCLYCCKSPKPNKPENLAEVDLRTTLSLRRLSTPLRRRVIDFGRHDMVPHLTSPRVKRISGSKICVRHSKKTFSTLSPKNRHRHDASDANKRDHSIISSARIRMVGGNSRPSEREPSNLRSSRIL